MVDGKLKTLLVHRKGSTRAFPPHHPLIPVDYQFIGMLSSRHNYAFGDYCQQGAVSRIYLAAFVL